MVRKKDAKGRRMVWKKDCKEERWVRKNYGVTCVIVAGVTCVIVAGMRYVAAVWCVVAGVGQVTPVVAGVGQVTPVVAGVGQVTPVVTGVGQVTPVVADVGQVTPVVTGVGQVIPVVTGVGHVTPVVAGVGQVTPVVAGVGQVTPAVADVGQVTPMVTGVSQVTPVVTGGGQVTPVVAGGGQVTPVVAGVGQVTPVVAGVGQVTPVVANVGQVTPMVTGVGQVIPVVAGIGQVTPVVAGVGQVTPVVTGVGQVTPVVAACQEWQREQEINHTDTGVRTAGEWQQWQWEAQEAAATAGHNGTIFKFRFSAAPQLRVAAEEWFPHTRVRWAGGGAPVVSGPCRKLLDLLARCLNFKYTFVRGDGYLGDVQKDGSWSGMLGMLRRNEADIALGPFGLSVSRRQVVDFTVPLSQEIYRIMTARPHPLHDTWVILTPFTWSVWVSLLASLLGMWLTSLLVARFTLDPQGPWTPGDHLLTVYAVLVSQGLTREPREAAMRIICLTWMFVSLIITSYFKSSFTSLLTVKYLKTLDSLKDLLADQSLALVLEGNTTFVSVVQNSSNSEFQQLAEALKVRGKFLNPTQLEVYVEQHLASQKHQAALLQENIIMKLMDKDYAHTGTRPQGYTPTGVHAHTGTRSHRYTPTQVHAHTGYCNFYMSADSLYSMYVSMAVPEGSPLLQYLNARILLLLEHGIYKQWVHEELYGASFCQCHDHHSVHDMAPYSPYNMMDLKIAFAVLGAGCCVAALILFWDIAYARFYGKGSNSTCT
nr:probable glutamate receptor [Cherax quadricarinatus]